MLYTQPARRPASGPRWPPARRLRGAGSGGLGTIIIITIIQMRLAHDNHNDSWLKRPRQTRYNNTTTTTTTTTNNNNNTNNNTTITTDNNNHNDNILVFVRF